jgi:hypothetical protein
MKNAGAMSSAWSRISLAAVAPTSWRNGGGATRELLAWPDAADWTWRLSVAEVASDGPFSRFAGVTRWFAVLHGAGVNLNVNGVTHRLDGDSAPLCFDGDAPTGCTLIGGATQDINLMLREDRARARMLRVRGCHHAAPPTARTVAVFLARGAGFLDLNASRTELCEGVLTWGPVPAGAALRLQAHDAIWMEIEA